MNFPSVQVLLISAPAPSWVKWKLSHCTSFGSFSKAPRKEWYLVEGDDYSNIIVHFGDFWTFRMNEPSISFFFSSVFSIWVTFFPLSLHACRGHFWSRLTWQASALDDFSWFTRTSSLRKLWKQQRFFCVWLHSWRWALEW